MRRSDVLAVALACAVLTAAQGAAPDGDGPPYGTVVDGNRVNAQVMDGFRVWRSAACDRCHGANQEGVVGPSLLNSLKTMSREEFRKTIVDGRLEKGMPSWKESPNVMTHVDDLYAYLKGRSDGAITSARVELQK